MLGSATYETSGVPRAPPSLLSDRVPGRRARRWTDSSAVPCRGSRRHRCRPRPVSELYAPWRAVVDVRRGAADAHDIGRRGGPFRPGSAVARGRKVGDIRGSRSSGVMSTLLGALPPPQLIETATTGRRGRCTYWLASHGGQQVLDRVAIGLDEQDIGVSGAMACAHSTSSDSSSSHPPVGSTPVHPCRRTGRVDHGDRSD